MVHTLSGTDISNGRAAVPIPWVNDTTDDDALPKFVYDPLPKFSGNLPNRVFCECADGCSAQKGCACVQMSTIKLEQPGSVHNAHLLSENAFDSLFFECSPFCSCAGTCSNRLASPNDAQRNHLQIFKTPKAGFGCRTLEPIRKGSFVCFLGGEVLSFDYPSKTTQFQQIANAEKLWFTFNDKTRQLAFLVRLDKVANESRFFNSSCCPNLRLVHLFRDWLTPDRPFVAFVAISEIGVGQELSHYYGDRWLFEKIAVSPKFVCRCASPFCVWPPKANRREDNFFSKAKDRQLKAKKVWAELRQRNSVEGEEMKKKRKTEQNNEEKEEE